MKAKRYVDMGGVGLNVTAFLCPPATFESTVFSEATSILLKHVILASAMSVTVNFALRAGSSKQGNARRASVGSICVVAM
jgi:hypothetical protein